MVRHITFTKDRILCLLSLNSGDDAVIGVYHPYLAALVNSIVGSGGPLYKSAFQRRHGVTSGVASHSGDWQREAVCGCSLALDMKGDDGNPGEKSALS